MFVDRPPEGMMARPSFEGRQTQDTRGVLFVYTTFGLQCLAWLERGCGEGAALHTISGSVRWPLVQHARRLRLRFTSGGSAGQSEDIHDGSREEKSMSHFLSRQPASRPAAAADSCWRNCTYPWTGLGWHCPFWPDGARAVV